MKKIKLFVLLVMFVHLLNAQIFIASNCNITFYSYAPLENIEAINKTTKPIINTTSGAVQMKISISSFEFEKPLMKEHFNENYMETEKFPEAIFKGKINDTIDYSKDGEHKVTVKGTLNMHGVEKERTIEGTLIKKGDLIRISAKFKIHLNDHNIKVPSLYVKNLAEDVDVAIDAILEPYKKK